MGPTIIRIRLLGIYAMPHQNRLEHSTLHSPMRWVCEEINEIGSVLAFHSFPANLLFINTVAFQFDGGLILVSILE